MQLVLVWLLDLGSRSLETADSSVETATAHDGRRPHEGRPPAKGDTKPLQCTSGCTGKLGLTEDGAINVAALCPAQPAVLARCEVYATCLFGTPVKSAQYSALKLKNRKTLTPCLRLGA